MQGAVAMVRPVIKQPMQAELRLLGPKIVQVHVMRGNLEFSDSDEFQLIPEGET